MLTEKAICTTNWPGWPLNSHSFGAEFDEAARERMVCGGKALLPTLEKYCHLIGSSVLEVGPFFNPLFVQISGKDSRFKFSKHPRVTYLENDTNACAWLKQDLSARVIQADISNLNEHIFRENRLLLFFSSMILSQVINYIDFRKFMRQVTPSLEENSLLFINNVFDYGIPEFFSELRPRSIQDVAMIIEDLGFLILEKKLLPAPRPGDQQRMILVARKVRHSFKF